MDYHLFESEKIDVDLTFEYVEIYRFIELWQEGESVISIAEKMNRTVLEICLLVVDRAEIGEIRNRPTGIFANKEDYMAVDEIDRDQMICSCSMDTKYSEEYLQKLTNEELLELHERLMRS